MNDFVDYYEALQVHPKADPEVIERAYRTLIFKHHPDRGGNAEDARLLNEAFEVLRDPLRRAAYNLDWSAARAQTPPSRGPCDPRAMRAFDEAGWPDLPQVRDAFEVAWTRYEEWRTSGNGGVAEALGDATLRLVATASGSGVVQRQVIVELLGQSFPEGTDSLWLDSAVAELVLGGLPTPGTVAYPPLVTNAYQQYDRPGSELSDIDAFCQSLALYLYFVSKHYPEWARSLAESVPRVFNLRRITRLEKLVDLAGQPFSQSAWERWAADYPNIARGRGAGLEGVRSAVGTVAGLLLAAALPRLFRR